MMIEEHDDDDVPESAHSQDEVVFHIVQHPNIYIFVHVSTIPVEV